MKKAIKFLLPVLLVFTLQSCIDITEEITFNADGSGIYTSITDLSKFIEQMDLLAAMDTTGEMDTKMTQSMDSTFEENMKKYEQIKGVSMIKMDKSKEGIYKITLKFSNVTALNDVINTGKTNEDQLNLYTWSKGNISRKDGISDAIGLTNSEEEDSQKEMAISMLKDAKYRIIYHLPKPAKSMQNKNAVLSDKKKTVTLEVSLADIMEKKTSLSNTIKYK